MYLRNVKSLFSNELRQQYFFRYFLVALSAGVLSGCVSTDKMNFASFVDRSTAHFERNQYPVTTHFNNHQLVLAAPNGFCFDTTMEQHRNEGGFALLAKCGRLSGATTLSRSNGVIITASVGLVSPTAPRPDAQQLFQSYAKREPNATLLEMRNDESLSLIKLRDGAETVLAGASPVHWRGVFKEGQHVVLLTIYAPDDSQYLKAKGASLLKDIVRASHNATQLVLTTSNERKTKSPAAEVTP